MHPPLTQPVIIPTPLPMVLEYQGSNTTEKACITTTQCPSMVLTGMVHMGEGSQSFGMFQPGGILESKTPPCSRNKAALE